MADPRSVIGLLLVAWLALGASGKTLFFDPFDEPFGTKWRQSEDRSYEGNWKYAKSEGSEDYGMFIPDKAKKYGIATALEEPVDLTKGTVVLQYDVRLQKGYDCGGAYIKFLMPQPEGWKAQEFKDNTPYSIMFGPDKCGSTNKVHFIFRHKNPHTGEYVEHHLHQTPVPKTEWVAHVYTAVVNYANNSVKILIDDEEAGFGDLLSKDFKPSVLPPETIKDPVDKKPEDWDERLRIPDPAAAKPDDWDEDAPKEIPDADAVKPEGWLDDEPLEVDDPDATKPDDWDEEEDGEWEPPKIPNPKCEEGPGCGAWKRPMKRNPSYQGKWKAPLIDNPAYKGAWTARDIPNPDYFKLEHPNLEPISAVGIEIWTMTNEVMFDNILITDSEDEAAEIRKKYWKPKYDKEQALAKEKAQKEAAEKKAKAPKLSFKDQVFSKLHDIADLPFLKPVAPKLHELIIQGEDKEYLVYATILGVLFVLPLLLLLCLIPSRKESPAASPVPMEVAKKQDISTPDVAAGPEGERKSEQREVPKSVEEDEQVKEKPEEKPEEASVEQDKTEEILDAPGDGEEKVRRRTRRDS